MISRLKYFVYLILFVVILDVILGKFLQYTYNSERNIENDRLPYFYNKLNHEVLIFGSSRALYHYDSELIQEKTGLTCFNAGFNGQNIYFHLALLQSAIKKHPPKKVILDLMYIDFLQTSSEWDTDNLRILLPQSQISESAYEAILKRSKTEKIKLLSSIYPYNSIIHQLFINYFDLNDNDLKFKGLDKIWSGDKAEIYEVNLEIDSQKMDALFTFIETCISNDIELYIFISPHYAIHYNNSVYRKTIKLINENYGLFVLNHENDSLFTADASLFADPNHLNSDGARVFTEIIIEELIKDESK